jgi:epoxyqueuosine reductase QueG
LALPWITGIVMDQFPMPNKELFAELERLLRDRGASLVACADLLPLPEDVRSGLPVGVCIGVALAPRIIAEIETGPTIAYAAEYDRVNALLGCLAEDGAAFLQNRGFHAIASRPTLHKLDPANLATPLPHKTVATRAGIGWIGKCALLVNGTFGTAIRYVTVLTDAPLPTGTPIESSRCGSCTACVDACPAEAISGRAWEPKLKREEFFDASACYDEAVRQGVKAGRRIICGICIAVCPHTKRYLVQAEH